MATSKEGWTRNKHSLILKLHRIIILFLLFKILKENLKTIFHIFIIDKSKGVIFVTLEMLENEGLWYMPLDHKINIKRYLGYCTRLLESFSCGNQIPSWHQSKWWEQSNRENVCTLDGLWTVVKLKEKFYMKGLLTIAWDTFSLWETLFPTSTASFSVTKSIVLSQTINVCSAMNAIKSQHVTVVLGSKSHKSLLQSGDKRNENSSQTSDFDF